MRLFLCDSTKCFFLAAAAKSALREHHKLAASSYASILLALAYSHTARSVPSDVVLLRLRFFLMVPVTPIGLESILGGARGSRDLGRGGASLKQEEAS